MIVGSRILLLFFSLARGSDPQKGGGEAQGAGRGASEKKQGRQGEDGAKRRERRERRGRVSSVSLNAPLQHSNRSIRGRDKQQRATRRREQVSSSHRCDPVSRKKTLPPSTSASVTLQACLQRYRCEHDWQGSACSRS